MAKNVLIIGGSPRIGGNSDILCDQFAKGAIEAGNQVEKISLAGKKIGFCTACYTCEKTGACPQKDDAAAIIEKMLAADVIVLATPVYFYTMSAQLKALIDRSVMVYPRIEKKDFYYIMTMADTETENFRGTIEALRGLVLCCEESQEKGMICAEGVYQKGEVLEHTAMTQAYEMGKNA
ncbi:MAG: flavodoxin family protein [Lentisphaeria bacterium]|nr:flavodoxin family protein [Lentisphaeria bacterium]